MKTDAFGTKIAMLTYKEYNQYVLTASRVQPYLSFSKSSFCELVKIAQACIAERCNNLDRTVDTIEKFRRKYYPFGFKENKDYLYFKQCVDFYQPRMKPNYSHYEKIERDTFVMTFRACKRYIYGNFTHEARTQLLKDLKQINNILN